MYHANSKLQLKYRITNFNPSWNVLKRPVLEDNGWPFENYELWCYCGSTLLRVCSSNLSKTNIQKYFNHFNVSMCLKQTTLPLYNVIEMIIIPTYLWVQLYYAYVYYVKIYIDRNPNHCVNRICLIFVTWVFMI